jgi:predicted HTH transcriptional regulator
MNSIPKTSFPGDEDVGRLQHIQSLIENPRERLSVELKHWFDPQTPEGVAKLVRAAIALRNNNGGYLVIGIDDKTHKPTPPPVSLVGITSRFN